MNSELDPLAGVKNVFDPVPRASGSVGPEAIVVATLDFEVQGGDLIFSVSQAKPVPAQDIKPFVDKLLAPDFSFSELFKSLLGGFVTPFDIDVRRPSWVVIVLKEGHNWQFQNGEAGVTLKVAHTGKTVELWHAWLAGGVIQHSTSPPTGDGCRIVYFQCMARAAAGQPGDSESVNLHLEFIQTNGGVEKRLIMIADPDIKNQGNQPYPP